MEDPKDQEIKKLKEALAQWEQRADRYRKDNEGGFERRVKAEAEVIILREALAYACDVLECFGKYDFMMGRMMRPGQPFWNGTEIYRVIMALRAGRVPQEISKMPGWWKNGGGQPADASTMGQGVGEVEAQGRQQAEGEGFKA